MPVKDKLDNPKFRNQDSFAAHFKKELKGNSESWAGAMAASSFLMFAAAVGSMLWGVIDVELPVEDPDTYTGLFNQEQRYSFYTPGPSYNQYSGSVFLMHNEVGYGVYRASEHDHERLLFVADEQEALQYIDNVQARLQQELDDLREAGSVLSPFSEGRTSLSTCEYVSAPFEYLGGVERFVSDHYSKECERVEGTPTEREAAYEQALAEWVHAELAITSGDAAYGYNPDDLEEMRIVTDDEKFLERFLMISGSVGSVIFCGTVIVAAHSRRKSLKEKGQKSTPKP